MKPNFKDMTGQRFGRLVVVRLLTIGKQARWVCQCDCGETVSVFGYNIRTGLTKSCGCLRREVAQRFAKHGETRSRKLSSEYSSYRNMLDRCRRETNPAYKDYGGRGIGVCQRWMDSFDNFLADMGRKPSPHHSIDRVNNDGPYDPDNCRWATPAQQAKNRRARSDTRLTPDVVREIRASSDSTKVLAARFGAGHSTIRAARSARSWKAIK